MPMHQASQLTIDLVSRPSASRRQPTTCRTGGPTWVEPAQLPSHGDVSSVGGNAPYWVKHLNNNTFMSYGVGNEDCFAHPVGKAVRFVEVNVTARCGASVGEPDVLEASTVAHVTVSKNMLNGAGMMHGGCIAYLIDICCSTALVVLGLARNTNCVGVTQSMTVNYHSPAPLGTGLRISSTSIYAGSRVMSSRCEITAINSGRIIASALLNKMQPRPAATAKL